LGLAPWILPVTDAPASISVALGSINSYYGIMKTTIDIPESDLTEAMHFTRAKTKREAVVTAIQDFNRRNRMAALVRHSGTCEKLASVEELQKLRRKS
jgi:Arc/MetJ family transcription regulator